MKSEEIKQLDPKEYDYAINSIIFFSIDDVLNDSDSELHKYRKDFFISKEDVINTTISQLDYLEVDYMYELKLAEEQFEKIVNTFINQWGDKYSIEDVCKQVDHVFFRMIMSTYNNVGCGMWEYVDQDSASYPGEEKPINNNIGFTLINKILEKYNDK